MEFRTLEVFHAVATTKSFARAAEVLHMTQSAVSQRIASLEAQLGCRVLDCTNRGATLTPKGYILFGYAEKLPATRSELIQTLTEMESESRLIRLCVAETIAQTSLPTFIGAVSVRYPLVIFEIEVDVSTNLRARLLTPALIGTELREGRLAVLDVAVTLPMLEYVTGSGGQIWTILPKLQPTWRASMRSNITFASIKLYA